MKITKITKYTRVPVAVDNTATENTTPDLGHAHKYGQHVFGKSFCTRGPYPTPCLTPIHLGPQKCEIWNLLIKTFHIIYDIPTFYELWIFALDHPAPPPRWVRKHKFWNVLNQDISCDIRHSYRIITLNFCTWWPRPTTGSKMWNLKPTWQDLSYAFCSKNFGFDDSHTPSLDTSENINSKTYSSRPFIWYTICL